jgi:hypothetical protein
MPPIGEQHLVRFSELAVFKLARPEMTFHGLVRARRVYRFLLVEKGVGIASSEGIPEFNFVGSDVTGLSLILAE